MRRFTKSPVAIVAIALAIPVGLSGQMFAADAPASSPIAAPDDAAQPLWQTVSRWWDEANALRATAPSSIADHASDEIGSDIPLGRDGKPLTPELTALGEKVRRVLALYETKHLNARDHSSWEVMHGLIAFGPRTQIYRDGPGGATVNAMGWLCWGGRCRGDVLLILNHGKPHARYGVGLQGHDGQYLAMLAQWRVLPTSPMKLAGKDLTVADYIEEEKVTCRSGIELTFKLIALSHYLPSDDKWTSRYGQQWTIPKLLKAEIEAPIRGAACGGTHRLFGISNAYKVRLKRGEPLDGEYARAHKYITDYHRYTFGSLQNPDGSFSTEWFNYPANRSHDPDRKLQTTGHILEWLAWSLPDEQLRDPRMTKAVDFLSGLLLDNPNRRWSIGPLGHGLHALMIYHERMFTEPPLPPVQIAASQPLKTAAKPTASINNPPEPSCDHCIDSLPAAKLKPVVVDKKTAEQSDGCVDAIAADQQIDAPGSANSPTIALPDPVLRPAPASNLRR